MARSLIQQGEGHDFPISLQDVGIPASFNDTFNNDELDRAARVLLIFLKDRNNGWEPFLEEEFITWYENHDYGSAGRCRALLDNMSRYYFEMGPGAITPKSQFIRIVAISKVVFLHDYFIYGVYAAWRASPEFQSTKV